MSATDYSSDNGIFSDKGHLAAQRLLYPKLLKCSPENMTFESTLLNTSEKNTILDGEMAVDRIVNVKVDRLKMPLSITVQERFRKPHFAEWQDITITEWNNNSNLPSELYKIKSGLFLYGYYDQIKDTFLDAIAFSVIGFQMKMINGELKYSQKPNPRSNQDFIGIKFSALEKAGLVLYRYNDHSGDMKQCSRCHQLFKDDRTRWLHSQECARKNPLIIRQTGA